MHVAALEEAQAFVTLDGSTTCERCCAPPYSDDHTVLTGG